MLNTIINVLEKILPLIIIALGVLSNNLGILFLSAITVILYFIFITLHDLIESSKVREVVYDNN